MALSSGVRLGPYEILAPLGAGGMGEVWRAKDTRLDRSVAIKVLPDSFSSHRERVARFEREAKLLATLRHPGIATIHSFEEFEGRRLLVMELADGEGLDVRMARGPIAPDEALPIARQIVDALEAAHEQGVVHRDLKPANVKVTADGRVKLLDFGLAKAMAPELSAANAASLEESPTVEASPTAAGTILGTAPYMAPEQARGRPVDRRADIWAFGVLLWEMLTGRRLFTGGSASDVLVNVLTKPIDFEAVPRETPGPIRRLMKRCLERDARRRLRDIGEARVALDELASAPPEEARPADRRVRLAPFLVTLATGVALGVAAGWLLRPAASKRPVRSVAFPVDRLLSTFKQGPLVSPDGTHVLYIADKTVRVQSLADPLAAPLDLTPVGPGSDISQTVFWSFDGASVAVAREHRLWRFPANGGSPTAICDVPESGEIQGGDWGGDDTISFAVWNGAMYRVPGSGGRPEVLLQRDPKSEIDFHAPRLLPGNHGLLLLPHNKNDFLHDVEVLAGGRRTRVLRDTAPLQHVVYAFGSLLFDYWGKEGIWEVPFSLSSLATTGRPRLLLADGTCPSVADDGTLLFVRGVAAPLRELVWVKADGSVLASVGSPARSLGDPILSPDGTRAVVSRGAEHPDLWSIDVARGAETRLAGSKDEDELFPSWSPAGDRVFYQRVKGQDSSLCWVDASGARTGALAIDPDAVRAALEPDGRHIVYIRDDGSGSGELARVPVDAGLRPSGPPERLAESSLSQSQIAIAPRGGLVAYAASQGERIETFLLELGGAGRWQVSNGGGVQPRWSRQGDRLFFVSGDEMMEVVVRRGESLSLGTPRRLFTLSERGLQPGPGFDVAPDGLFLMVRDAEPKRIVVVVNGAQLLRRR